MIAKILPNDADKMALKKGISFAKAAINATSEEKGKMVAAKKAEKKSASSVMRYSQLLMR